MANFVLKLAAGVSRLLPSSLKAFMYRLGPLSALIRIMLTRAAPRGLHLTELSAHYLPNTKMQLDLQAEKDYWLGTYELDLQKALYEHIKPGMVIYDVGANIGFISLLAAQLAGAEGRVFAFEALPANIERLEKNVTLNPGRAPIDIVPKAVTDRSGKETFFVHSSNAMGRVKGSKELGDYFEKEIVVKSLSLDDFVFVDGKQAPNLVKVDIEGDEYRALSGMEGILSTYHPTLFIEVHGEKSGRDVLEILTRKNYSLHSLRREKVLLSNDRELSQEKYVMAKSAK